MDTVIPDDDRDQTGTEPEPGIPREPGALRAVPVGTPADEAPHLALEAAWARYQQALAAARPEHDDGAES